MSPVPIDTITTEVSSISLMNGDADKESESQRTPHADKPPSECPFPHEPTDPNNTCPISPALFDPLNPPTQEISPELLRTSLHDRINYLKDFILFRKADQDILHKVAPLVNDLIPQVVDELYSKLFEFDVTKQIFLQRNEGFDGPLPSKLEDLTLSSPQLIYRKIFMKSWARRVLTSDYSDPAGKTWAYMDKVGIMHTGVKAFKHREGVKPLVVPYRDCALSLGWVQTVLQTAILRLDTDLDKSAEGEEGDTDEERKRETLSMEEKISAVAAVSKVIWIQNDLFARHYIDE